MGYQHLWKPSYNRHIHLIPHISKSHHIIFCRQNIRDLGVNSQCLGKLVRQCYIYIYIPNIPFIYIYIPIISPLYPREIRCIPHFYRDLIFPKLGIPPLSRLSSGAFHRPCWRTDTENLAARREACKDQLLDNFPDPTKHRQKPRLSNWNHSGGNIGRMVFLRSYFLSRFFSHVLYVLSSPEVFSIKYPLIHRIHVLYIC